MPVLVGGKPPKKPFNVKGEWLAIGFGIPLALVLMFLNNAIKREPSPSIPAQTQVTAPTPSPALPSASAAPSSIVSAPILGATKTSFDNEYGPGLDAGFFTRYQNDYLHVTFINDQAEIILVQFEQRGESRRSKTEALAIATPFLPDDAVKGQERQHDEDSYVIRYSSQELAQTLSIERFSGEPPGTFIVIIQHDPYNPDSAFAVLIAPGDNP